MQEQLKETKSSVEQKQKEIIDLKTDLEKTKSSLGQAEAELERARGQVKTERGERESQVAHWQDRCYTLEQEVQRLSTELQVKQESITGLQEHAKQVSCFVFIYNDY